MARYEDTFILRDKVSKTIIKISQGFQKFDTQLGKSMNLLNRFEQRTANLRKVGESVKSVGQGLTVGLTLPIVAAGGAAVKFASDYEEALNKIDVAFGNSSQSIKDWSKNALVTMGMSKGEALDSAALYGSIATGMGIAQDKAAEMAMVLTKRGADLASFMNVRGDVAQTALKSIFTGESESLKNLGVTMTEATLQSYAYSKGLRKKIKDMSETEKVMLRYKFVLDRTKLSEDDFIETGGAAANQMRTFQSSLKELGETFGQYILPAFTKVLKSLNSMIKAFAQLPAPVQKGIIVFGAILAVIGPLLLVAGQFLIILAALPKAIIGAKLGMAALSKGIAFLNSSMLALLANPITLWVIGITAGIAGLIKLIDVIVKKMRLVKQGLNLKNQEDLAVLSGEYSQIGAKEFKKKYGGGAVKAVEKFNTTNNTTNTTNNTTNNNYYAGASPKNAKYAK